MLVHGNLEALVVGLDQRVEEVLEVVVTFFVPSMAADEGLGVKHPGVDRTSDRPLSRA